MAVQWTDPSSLLIPVLQSLHIFFSFLGPQKGGCSPAWIFSIAMNTCHVVYKWFLKNRGYVWWPPGRVSPENLRRTISKRLFGSMPVPTTQLFLLLNDRTPIRPKPSVVKPRFLITSFLVETSWQPILVAMVWRSTPKKINHYFSTENGQKTPKI